jgi:hypothetical protein
MCRCALFFVIRTGVSIATYIVAENRVLYEVAFAQNVRLGFCAFHRVTPSKIEKLVLFQNRSTYYRANNGDPLFLVSAHTH